MPDPMTDDEIGKALAYVEKHPSSPKAFSELAPTIYSVMLRLIARVEADRQKIERLVVALSEARHVIDTKYGPPGTNRLDRETLSKIDDALGREEGK